MGLKDKRTKGPTAQTKKSLGIQIKYNWEQFK